MGRMIVSSRGVAAGIVLLGSLMLLIPDPAHVAGAFDYNDALSKSILFYEGQRSGRLPANQRVTWRGNSGDTDGALENVDLTGGYYDAGDNVKFGWPMAHTVTMLSWGVIQYESQLSAAGELENARAAIKWATDFLLKAVVSPTKLYTQVGDGNTDHQCWERPEDMDTSRTLYHIDESNPGTEPAADTAAALAAACIVFQATDSSYSAQLLQKAVQMFNFANNYQGSYGQSCPFYCSFSGFQDELLWGAAWLYKSTGDQSYLQFLKDNVQNSQTVTEFSWDNKYAGAQILLSQTYFAGDQALAQYNTHAVSYVCAYMEQTVPRTPGGFAFTRDNNNAQYTLGAAYLLVVYADQLTAAGVGTITCGSNTYTPQAIIIFSKSQLDYILGSNPQARSYMAGFGTNYPQQLHHRGASIPSITAHPAKVECNEGYNTYYGASTPNPNVHVGAVVGGPNQNDEFNDVRSDYNHLEPIVYMNAPCIGLIARCMSV